MEWVKKQIDELKKEQTRLEEAMLVVQRRHNFFTDESHRLYKMSNDERSEIFHPFVTFAGDLWEPIMLELSGDLDEGTYDRCRDIMDEHESPMQMNTHFLKACPHVVLKKLQAQLCEKSQECLKVTKRLTELFELQVRVLDGMDTSCSYHRARVS